jgi:hypothetical protein
MSVQLLHELKKIWQSHSHAVAISVAIVCSHHSL